MKKIAILMLIALCISIFAGCSGDVVVIGGCTCPTGSHNTPTNPQPSQPAVEGALKTGLAIVCSTNESENGVKAAYDVTLVAVLVDDEGIIRDCIIDSIGTEIAFDATGTITSDITAEIKTKNELGDSYGMVAWGGAVAEWDAQAASFAAYVTGKTPAEVAGMALNEKTAPADADLATSVTISVIGFQNLIAKAAQ